MLRVYSLQTGVG